MMEKALAILLAVAVGGCAVLGWMFHSAQKGKEAALAATAKLSVVVDAQRSVIDAMQDDAEKRDKALAERDQRISNFNAAAYIAVEAIGSAANDPQCNLDSPLPPALSGPLFLLRSQVGGGDGSAGGKSDRAGVPVSTPPDARVPLSHDDAQSRTVDGAAHDVGS
jgi:hypothetical protein